MIPAEKKRWFETVFAAYNRWLIGRSFAGLHVRGLERWTSASGPVLLIANHSNWWDGLLLFQVNQLLLRRDFYVMMEEKGLRAYPFFRKLGAYSIRRDSTADIRASLRYTADRLQSPNALVCLFPQGRIRHQEVRPLDFAPGAALALRDAPPDAKVCLATLNYSFLEDQRPEAFLALSEPLSARDLLAADPDSAKELTAQLERHLTEQLDAQRAELLCGDATGYRNVLRGKLSTGDWYRRVFQRA